jgi:hypothetical protein
MDRENFFFGSLTAEEKKRLLYENAKSYRNALISLERIVVFSEKDRTLLDAARRTLTVLMNKDQEEHDAL